MKIAIVYLSLETVGGAENVVVWTAETLARRGHEVVIFTRGFSDNVWGNRAEKPYRVHVLDFTRSRSTLKMNAAAGAALAKALSSHTFDVVNAHNYPANLWVLYAKQQAPAFPRVLLYLHNLPYNFYERQINGQYRRLPGLRNIWNRYRPKKLFRLMRQALFHYRQLDRDAVLAADRVLANSRYAAALAREVYGAEVLPCPLGVSLDRFIKPGEGTRLSPSGNGRAMVLTVARIELQKNFDTILKAMAVLKKRGYADSFRYCVAGAGPQLAYFKRKAGRMGLDDVVRFLGRVPHEEIGSLYADAAFLVHVPLDEPFGLVPLEAALLKKASIVSDHGGPAEIVVNGETGLHVDALDPNDVANKIEALLTNRDQAVKMGEAAHAWVMNNLTWERFIDTLEAHLRQTHDSGKAL